MNIRYKHYFSLVSATVLTQGFIFLISPIVTRLYSPEHFGAFGTVLGIGAVISSLGSGRLEHAIPITSSQLQAIRVYVLGTILIVLSTVLVVIGILLIDNFVGFPNKWASLPVYAIPCVALTLALFNLTSSLLVRKKAYSSVGANKILQGASTGIFQMFLGKIGLVYSGLIYAQVLGYLLGCLIGFRWLGPRLVALIVGPGMGLRATFQRFRSFPLILAPAALFNQLSQQLPILLIGIIFTMNQAGLYAFVLRLCGAPLAIIGQAVSQVYAGEFRILLRQGGGGLVNYYNAILLRLFIVGLIVVSSLIIFLKLAGEHMFGPDWTQLGDVALYLGLMLLFDFVATPLSMTLGYLGREHYQLYWDIGRLLSIVLVFYIAVSAALNFSYTILLLSIVWASGLIVHIVIGYRVCKAISYARYSPHRILFSFNRD